MERGRLASSWFCASWASWASWMSCAVTSSAFAWPEGLETEVQSEFGVTSHALLHPESLTHLRPFIAQRLAQGLFNGAGAGKFVVGYRARADLRADFPNEQRTEIQLRELTFDHATDVSTFRLGVQEVVWGETFGLEILDIVNPRDFNEPLFSDTSEARIPVAMLNAQALLGGLTVQGIYTPLPSRSPVPKTLESIPIDTPRNFDAFSDAEYGGRIGFLFPFGLDLNVYSFNHWNRTPAYLLHAVPTGVAFRLEEARVRSFGASFSQAFESVVLRGDTILSEGVPIPTRTFQRVEKVTRAQTILGLDVTSREQTSLGLQYFIEDHDRIVDRFDRSRFQLAGARLAFDLFDKALETELMFFRGLDTADLWLNPRVTWNISAHWRTSVEANLVDVPRDGLLRQARAEDALEGRLSYRF